MIYLDSSAIVKLVRTEAESAALAGWINAQSVITVTSTLAEVELPRALRRAEPARLSAVPAVLARLNRVEMDPSVRATAGAYADTGLRSLDAIHLATAERLVATGRSVTAFVTYDLRQFAAATSAGFAALSPA